MSTNYSNQKKVEENFQSIFNNKGIVGSVGEKAFNNYKSKFRKNEEIQSALHYFAVGHTFKNIDMNRIFDVQLSDDEKGKIPTKYTSLQSSNFRFIENEKDQLKILIDSIRNINAHFIHLFDFIEKKKIPLNLQKFLNESFELALLHGIVTKNSSNKKKIKKVDYLTNEDKEEILTHILSNKDAELIKFMKEIFYQTLYTKSEKDWEETKVNAYKAKKTFLDAHLKTKDDWMEWILYNIVENDIIWKLNPKGDGSKNNHVHEVLDIPKGTYLSSEGCLFILSMFLYANEANYLIPKLKGFKKNGTPQDASKLEVFRFFAKKFKSQDVDSENNQLVKFRDIVQYLSKFPVRWNNHLHNDIYYVKELKSHIVEYEIKRCFGNAITAEFLLYAKCVLLGIKNVDEISQSKFNNINKQNKASFELQMNQNPEYKSNIDAIKNIESELKKLVKNEQNNENQKKIEKLSKSLIKHEENNSKLEKENAHHVNPNLEKLKRRINDNLLYISNGRNNDKFIEFATRYLAEINYFGEDVQFKMYQHFYPDDEKNAIEEKRNSLDKKEFDKLHYHDGKLVYFNTYKNQLNSYPDWDMPFVVQNNAIYIKINNNNENDFAAICIQRSLLTFLLEHALSLEQPANAGKKLLSEYIIEKCTAYTVAKENLEQYSTIKSEQKTAYKKLFPRRMLHHYQPAIQNNKTVINAFQKYLDQAEMAEQRYEAKKQQAIQENTIDLFLKKNKGKQFKLRFVTKACQLMFFRTQYDLQKEQYAAFEKMNGIEKKNDHEFGHHKKYNITRDEFNDFSKWMFAFDEVPQYKKHLESLFAEKKFLDNAHFKTLFESAKNIDDFYNKTKLIYLDWLNNNHPNNKADRFKWNDNYANWIENGNTHINLTHFIQYAIHKQIFKTENKKIAHPFIENQKYLFEAFYKITPTKQPQTNNEVRNFYFKLQKNKMEDVLLYEIAMRYMHYNIELTKNAYAHLSNLLQQDIAIKIPYNSNDEYTVIVPFKDIEKFAQLQYFDAIRKQQYQLLKNLPTYLNIVKNKKEQLKDIKAIIEQFAQDKTITLAHLSAINNHLITQQGRFTQCIMAMEEYFIWKAKFTIEMSISAKEKNRIVIVDIQKLENYFPKQDQSRNTAFHINLPINETYKEAFKTKEKKFVAEEVKPYKYKTLDDCPYMLKKTLLVFLNEMHDEITLDYKKFDNDKQKASKRKYAESQFFKQLFW